MWCLYIVLFIPCAEWYCYICISIGQNTYLQTVSNNNVSNKNVTIIFYILFCTCVYFVYYFFNYNCLHLCRFSIINFNLIVNFN